MSCIISDLVLYGSANMPEADSATTGGAIDFSKRVEFNASSISPATQFDVVSSSASDTATLCQISYRDATGVVYTPAAVTLTGTTKAVLTTVAGERLLAGVCTGGAIAGLSNPGGTKAVGDVAVMAHTLTVTAHTMQAGSANATSSAPAVAKLQSGDGAAVSVGMVLHTTGGTGSNGGVAITGTSTQTLALTRMFATAAADVYGGSSRTFYEKIFVNNNNQATALTAAEILLQSLTPALPGSAALNIALTNALNDTVTIANRQTAPAGGGITAYTSGAPPQGINVPSPQNLPASAGAGSATGAQGIWVQLVLPAGTAAYEGVPDFRTTGTST